MFFAIAGAVFFASFAMMVREGLWSNAITLLNVIISGLAAYGFYAPLAIMLDERTDGTYTYVLDFLCLWGLFVIAMVILRSITGAMSKTRLRLKHPIDAVGGPAVGLVAAWVILGFTLATMHTAPLSQDCLGGKLMHTNDEVASKSGITSPDLAWLRFVGRVGAPDALGSGKFKAAGFVQIYGNHRKAFEAAPGVRVKRG